MGENPQTLAFISAFKGLIYVMVTALALFLVLRAELRKHDRLEQALQDDIAERTRTLDALRASENRFTTVFHASPVPIGITRMDDGRIVDVNEAFTQMMGCQRDDLVGHMSIETGLWSDMAERFGVVEQIAAQGGLRNFEVHAQTTSGEPLHLLVSAQLIDLDGEPHIVSICYDMTEQKKLEDQIRYQALLLANVSDAVISTDIDFNILSWNPAAERIYGWTASEVYGQSALRLLKGEFANSTQAETIEELQSEGLWRGETVQYRKDGSKVYVLASTSYVTDTAGSRVGIVSVNRDITERKKAEEALKQAERQRLEFEKEKEVIELKEHFISLVSHEFRTPLAVIISSTELLRRYYDNLSRERKFKHLGDVVSQAEFMVSLLDSVLTVNKARAGKLDFNPAPLDLVNFCQTTLERIQVSDNEKHRLIFQHNGSLSDVALDAKLLQHILVNLLSNAVKYSPEGSDVHLEVRRQGGDVILRVSDQGIGIPDESLPQLYDPFVRATNTGVISGTGLGMAIVKNSVDAHQGTIACESLLDVGTTFTVKLPAAISSAPANRS